MLSWFRYRCALDLTSKEVVEGANEVGLDCFRAAQRLLLKGSVAASKAAEMAKLGRPGAPVSLVQCAMHGCTESGGKYIKAWIDN